MIFLPGFTPEIDKLGVRKGAMKVQERIPLHDGAHNASGKPNLTFDENTYPRPTRRPRRARSCRASTA